ncbi:MAG: ABC transporter permease [Chloroflexi bacterium]|nr:ABC transporter permease [Chloroflexota bacterium]
MNAKRRSPRIHHDARLAPYIAVLALLMAWEAVSRLALIDALLLPPPTALAARGASLLLSGRLLNDLLASAGRVFLGFGLAFLLSTPAGILLGLYPHFERLVSALLGLLRPLSPPAWIPLAILWFGIGDAPAIFIIFIGTFFSLLVGVMAATRALDPQWLGVALTLGASRRQTLRHVVLPGLLPALLTQARIGLALAWMCVIAAEMVAVRRGIGFMMSEARNLFRTEDVMVGMVVIGLVGLGSDRLLGLLERRWCRWRVGLSPAQLYGDAEEKGR